MARPFIPSGRGVSPSFQGRAAVPLQPRPVTPAGPAVGPPRTAGALPDSYRDLIRLEIFGRKSPRRAQKVERFDPRTEQWVAANSRYLERGRPEFLRQVLVSGPDELKALVLDEFKRASPETRQMLRQEIAEAFENPRVTDEVAVGYGPEAQEIIDFLETGKVDASRRDASRIEGDTPLAVEADRTLGTPASPDGSVTYDFGLNDTDAFTTGSVEAPPDPVLREGTRRFPKPEKNYVGVRTDLDNRHPTRTRPARKILNQGTDAKNKFNPKKDPPDTVIVSRTVEPTPDELAAHERSHLESLIRRVEPNADPGRLDTEFMRKVLLDRGIDPTPPPLEPVTRQEPIRRTPGPEGSTIGPQDNPAFNKAFQGQRPTPLYSDRMAASSILDGGEQRMLVDALNRVGQGDIGGVDQIWTIMTLKANRGMHPVASGFSGGDEIVDYALSLINDQEVLGQVGQNQNFNSWRQNVADAFNARYYDDTSTPPALFATRNAEARENPDLVASQQADAYPQGIALTVQGTPYPRSAVPSMGRGARPPDLNDYLYGKPRTGQQAPPERNPLTPEQESRAFENLARAREEAFRQLDQDIAYYNQFSPGSYSRENLPPGWVNNVDANGNNFPLRSRFSGFADDANTPSGLDEIIDEISDILSNPGNHPPEALAWAHETRQGLISEAARMSDAQRAAFQEQVLSRIPQPSSRTVEQVSTPETGNDTVADANRDLDAAAGGRIVEDGEAEFFPDDDTIYDIPEGREADPRPPRDIPDPLADLNPSVRILVENSRYHAEVLLDPGAPGDARAEARRFLGEVEALRDHLPDPALRQQLDEFVIDPLRRAEADSSSADLDAQQSSGVDPDAQIDRDLDAAAGDLGDDSPDVSFSDSDARGSDPAAKPKDESPSPDESTSSAQPNADPDASASRTQDATQSQPDPRPDPDPDSDPTPNRGMFRRMGDHFYRNRYKYLIGGGGILGFGGVRQMLAPDPLAPYQPDGVNPQAGPSAGAPAGVPDGAEAGGAVMVDPRQQATDRIRAIIRHSQVARPRGLDVQTYQRVY